MIRFEKKQVTTAVIIAVLLAIPGGIAWGAKMYVDNAHETFQTELTLYLKKIEGPFLTINEWRLAGAEDRESELIERIRSLQYDIDHGLATEKDKWLIEELREDLRQEQQKISKLISDRPTV